MAEFLSQDEIDNLLDIAEEGEQNKKKVCLFLDYYGVLRISSYEDNIMMLEEDYIPTLKALIKEYNIDVYAHSTNGIKAVQTALGDDIVVKGDTNKDMNTLKKLGTTYDVKILIDDEVFSSLYFEQEYNVDYIVQPDRDFGITDKNLYHLRKYLSVVI